MALCVVLVSHQSNQRPLPAPIMVAEVLSLFAAHSRYSKVVQYMHCMSKYGRVIAIVHNIEDFVRLHNGSRSRHEDTYPPWYVFPHHTFMYLRV